MNTRKFVIFAMLPLLCKPVLGDDINAGQEKSAMCMACHGTDGNSLVGQFPKLAGQHAEYLSKQLHDFKDAMLSGGKKGRVNPIMGAMAVGLSEEDMDNLAVYYAKNTMSSVQPATTDETDNADTSTVEEQNSLLAERIAKGKLLYQGGDFDRKISACIACHGVAGKGVGLAKFPKLSQQHPEYIKTQLMNFKMGNRANDPNSMMRAIANKLTDDDIQALTDYIASL